MRLWLFLAALNGLLAAAAGAYGSHALVVTESAHRIGGFRRRERRDDTEVTEKCLLRFARFPWNAGGLGATDHRRAWSPPWLP